MVRVLTLETPRGHGKRARGRTLRLGVLNSRRFLRARKEDPKEIGRGASRREVQIEIAGETILQNMLISFRNCGRFEIDTLGTFAQKQGDNRSGLVAQVSCARSNLQRNLPKQLQFPRKAGN